MDCTLTTDEYAALCLFRRLQPFLSGKIPGTLQITLAVHPDSAGCDFQLTGKLQWATDVHGRYLKHQTAEQQLETNELARAIDVLFTPAPFG